MKTNKRGFTLIELIIVLIIIGILASIAAPMMRGMTGKAIYGEAITAMGAIRTALQIYYVEYQAYPNLYAFFNEGGVLETTLRIKYNDFKGTYFFPDCYYVESATDGYIIYAFPKPDESDWGGLPNGAPKASDAQKFAQGANSRLQMDTRGKVTQYYFKQSVI